MIRLEPASSRLREAGERRQPTHELFLSLVMVMSVAMGLAGIREGYKTERRAGAGGRCKVASEVLRPSPKGRRAGSWLDAGGKLARAARSAVPWRSPAAPAGPGRASGSSRAESGESLRRHPAPPRKLNKGCI